MSAGPRSSDNLEVLKELMLGDEQREIEALREKLEGMEIESVERLSRDLAAAVELRSQMGDESFDELVKAIQSGTESAIQRSVREDKSKLAKALFPIMGPAIRSYVVELFRSMGEDLNETIRNTTSIERLKWRFDAKMAGMPYSEFVLIKTANYEVEELFLMQRETGLLLQHVTTDPEDDDNDADLVSGMFTAIRSFVKDSFSDGDEDTSEELKRFTFGERQVVIEDSPTLVLAAVVRGTPPPAVRNELKAILEELHRQFGEEADDFSGDMEEMAPARPYLERGLMKSGAASAKKGSGLWRIWLILGLLVAGIGTWIGFSMAEQRRWDRFEEALKAEPGIGGVVIGEEDGKRTVVGFRDPMANDPSEIAGNFGIDPEKARFQFTEWHSLEPEFVARREAEMEKAWSNRRSEVINEVATSINAARERADATAGTLKSTQQELESTRKEIEASGKNLSSAMEELLGSTRTEFDRKLQEAESRHQAASTALLRELLQSRYGHLEGVDFAFDDGGVTVTGSAPEPEHSQLLAQLETIPSIGSVDSSGLKNETEARISDLIVAIGVTPVKYESGTLTTEDIAILDLLASMAAELDAEAAKLGREYRFDVVAHPLIGTFREGNRRIEQSRAEQVRDRLIEAGIPAARLTATIDEDESKAGGGVSLVPKTDFSPQ